MGRFGNDPAGFFDSVYRDRAPWDIGAPQPALEQMLDRFPPANPILDIGCGSGDLAIWLASRGHSVLGIDFIPAPIDIARRRLETFAPEQRERVRFQVADALRPTALGRTFGAVVDSGFFHLFDPDIGKALADEVCGTLVPGGRYYMVEFAREFPVENTPREVPQAEIQALFSEANGWRLLAVQSALFHSNIAPVPAICVCAETLTRS